MKTGIRSICEVLILLIVSFQSCGQMDTNTEMFDQFLTQQIETRDSLFILHTVKEWGKKNWYTFADYSKMYKMTNDQVEYFIGGTFYSPDRKKLLVWIGERKPNALTREIYNEDDPEVNKLCPNGKAFVYSMTALIGIRDSVNQIWSLYPFNEQQATCYESINKVINILGQYYFVQMKSDLAYRMMQSGARKGHKESQAYGYNLQDEDFWSKCWLFEKDTVGSYGLYPFQIKGYDYIGDRCTPECAEPYHPPVVVYPLEILKLYK